MATEGANSKTTPNVNAFTYDVPTIAESGYKDYQLDFWLGLVAPAKTPEGNDLPARRLVHCGSTST